MGNQLDQCVQRFDKRLDGTQSRAIYSKCGRYRYLLQRTWDDLKPPLIMIMLNPSTATEIDNDPTVERCQRRAFKNDYGGLIVLNIFAYRATDPEVMRIQSDPVGVLNNYFIEDTIKQFRHGNNIVCGWGTHGRFKDRQAVVLDLLHKMEVEPLAYKWTKQGHPQHPLYVAYSEKPKRCIEK